MTLEKDIILTIAYTRGEGTIDLSIHGHVIFHSDLIVLEQK